REVSGAAEAEVPLPTGDRIPEHPRFRSARVRAEVKAAAIGIELRVGPAALGQSGLGGSDLDCGEPAPTSCRRHPPNSFSLACSLVNNWAAREHQGTFRDF